MGVRGGGSGISFELRTQLEGGVRGVAVYAGADAGNSAAFVEASLDALPAAAREHAGFHAS